MLHGPTVENWYFFCEIGEEKSTLKRELSVLQGNCPFCLILIKKHVFLSFVDSVSVCSCECVCVCVRKGICLLDRFLKEHISMYLYNLVNKIIYTYVFISMYVLYGNIYI